MYKTEAEFSRSLSAKLKEKHMDVTRIESHSTGNGIPDMFVQGLGWDTFLELKNKPKDTVIERSHKINWRPGQQAWMLTYFMKHAKQKCCLTIQACSDGLLIIPHVARYINGEYIGQGITWDELKKINIRMLLRVMSNCVTYNDCKTYREAVNLFMEEEYGTLVEEYSILVDYDPEVLWEADTIDNNFVLAVWQCNLLSLIAQVSHYI